jgi:hypothetical protein
MRSGSLASALLIAAAAAPVGVALGWGYFAALRRSVQTYLEGGRTATALSATAARIGIAAIVFALFARLGIAALLGASAGFLLARTICLKRFVGPA